MRDAALRNHLLFVTGNNHHRPWCIVGNITIKEWPKLEPYMNHDLDSVIVHNRIKRHLSSSINVPWSVPFRDATVAQQHRERNTSVLQHGQGTD